MAYNTPLNSNTYGHTGTSVGSNYLSDPIRQRKLNDFSSRTREFQAGQKESDSNSFLRNTMGSFKPRANRQLFVSSARQTGEKEQPSLRHTTGNLADLLKRIDFQKQYKGQKPIISKKYSEVNTLQAQDGFRKQKYSANTYEKQRSPKNLWQKQKTSSNVFQSKPSSKYQYFDSKNDTSISNKSIDEILNKLKRQKQLDNQIQRLKQQKQEKARAAKGISSNSTQNYASSSYTSYNTKQSYSKNPQDSYSNSLRKGPQTAGTIYRAPQVQKKYQYDFSRKSKVSYGAYTPKKQYEFEKKYEDYGKKYDTASKAQYDWKKASNVTSTTASYSAKQGKKTNYETTEKQSSSYAVSAKSPIQSSTKEDKLSMYFSSSSSKDQKGEKFECKVSLKDFKLGKSLGQGKFGTVFQAVHKATNSLYALKKVPKATIKSYYMIDQFILQLKLQTYMNHQSILAIYGFFHDYESIYLILDYMEEGTLYTLLKKNKKLEIMDAARKIKEISKGIIYMHENGIAHRDIKPENVVMSNGSCKLCDFGWSTICDERRKTYCGTFDYAAPQILQGTEYDMSVDLWCLGVLAYELLVGKAPFYHIKKQETKKRILNVQSQPIIYPPELPKDAVDFIESLLKKDPQERIKIQELLRHPFLAKA